MASSRVIAASMPGRNPLRPTRETDGPTILKAGRFVMTELRFPDLRRIAGLMLLGALLALPLRVDHAMAAGNFPPAYVVAGVPVDATAKDAVTAREAAREEGQRTALRRLLERLTPRSDWSRLPAPNGADIAALVQDFEVSDEH